MHESNAEMKKEKSNDDIYQRLSRIYREFSKERRVDPDSHMCCFWEDQTVEILEDSDELNAIETEFCIFFNEDTAMELYDMTLFEAAKFIKIMIQQQCKEEWNSESIIDELDPNKAKLILRKIWQDSIKGRDKITAAINKINFEDNLRNKEGI